MVFAINPSAEKTFDAFKVRDALRLDTAPVLTVLSGESYGQSTTSKRYRWSIGLCYGWRL
jgi:hypothetical protein